MKHLDVVATIRTVRWLPIWILITPIFLSSCSWKDMMLRGLKDASISMPDSGIVADNRVKDAILEGIKSGDIWLNKIKYDDKGQRIYGNVCLEVYLPSRGTCLLQHINMSACDPCDLHKAFAQGMSSCAISMAEQVLEGLENTYPRVKTGKSGSECLAWPTSSDDVD